MLRQQLAETEKSIENMLNAIQQGIITASTKERLDKLEATNAELKIALLQEEITRPLLTREQVLFYLQRFRKLDVTKKDQRQRLIDSFINAIYLFDDKIVLTFNYKDETKTITFNELSEVLGSGFFIVDGVPIWSLCAFLWLIIITAILERVLPLLKIVAKKRPRIASNQGKLESPVSEDDD